MQSQRQSKSTDKVENTRPFQLMVFGKNGLNGQRVVLRVTMVPKCETEPVLVHSTGASCVQEPRMK